MPNFMAANFAILAQRWPRLANQIEEAADSLPPFSLVEKCVQTLVIDGTHLTSAYDRDAEAQLQTDQIPLQSPKAWVYGMALGDIPRVLLSRKGIKQITVVVMNHAAAALSLFFFDHRDWLDDPRVTLVTACPTDPLHKPYAVAPGCLQLASDQAGRLRDLVCLDLATPFIRKRHQADNPHLQKRLADNAEYIAQDPSIDALLTIHRSNTVVVAGAGPTLSDQYGWMKDHKPGPIIAVDAAIKPLMHAGIVPDIVVAIDGHADIYDLFFATVDQTQLKGTSLVYFPVVQSELLSHWPGPRYVACSAAPIYAPVPSLRSKQRLFSSGSVIHPAVDLASRLSAKSVILTGTDFCYPGGQSHVSGCAQEQPVQGSHWVLNSNGNRVSTIPNLRAYLRDMEDFISGKKEITFFNASPRGADILHTTMLTELP